MQKEGLNHSRKKNHSLINYNYGGVFPAEQTDKPLYKRILHCLFHSGVSSFKRCFTKESHRFLLVHES